MPKKSRPNITLSEYKKAYREIKKEEAQRGFWIHFVVYFLVNGMLILVNIIYSPGAWWFFYPLIGWGIGITTHYLVTCKWIDKGLELLEAKTEYRARNHKKK